jgi:alpha-galactosidase
MSAICLFSRRLVTVFLCLFTLFGPQLTTQARATDSVSPTPPMGWNRWNKFQCNVSESLIREMADAMVLRLLRAQVIHRYHGFG